MQKITPCLWFEDKAEEAVKFYVSLFKGSKIIITTRFDEAGGKAAGRPEGSVMTIDFKLGDQEFMALNGGPMFNFTQAVSFMVNCETQSEVDKLWSKLADGGKEMQCGWLTDKYGLPWQIIPTILGKYMTDPDPEKVARVTKAMLQMKKIEIADLKQAYKSK
ncbi:MAG: VOC family protein [Patescibacteria group bacterium]|jgi:predicted 3-demethylubiquinone-9 3-methyltransferase (glyoxalase superfamily)